MGAREWEEQRPQQSREPPRLWGCCVSPFPSQERAPKHMPQITLPPASPPAGSSSSGLLLLPHQHLPWLRRHPDKDGQTQPRTDRPRSTHKGTDGQ